MSVISINANIGAGKSTLIRELQKSLKNDNNYIFIQEPVEIWQKIVDEKGVDLLTNFYTTPAKFSFQFQIAAYISRLSLIRNAIRENPGKIIITERCMHTDRNVFAKMLYDDNHITKIEFDIYNMWFNEFLDDIKNIKYVYIDTDPKICYNRVHHRARSGEELISIEYLEKCHHYHKQWLESIKDITILDGNEEFENDKDIIDKWLDQIKGIFN